MNRDKIIKPRFIDSRKSKLFDSNRLAYELKLSEEKKAESIFMLDTVAVDSVSLTFNHKKHGILPANAIKRDTSPIKGMIEKPAVDEPNNENEYSFLSDIFGSSNLKSAVDARNLISNKTEFQLQSQQQVDDTSKIMSTIKTGDDALNFFARYGSETPVKFIILIQNSELKQYAPYDLIVVNNQNDVVKQHYVMTSDGIVSISPTEQSDCLPLSVWMKQKLDFSHLRSIPFFKYYLHRKIFTIWFENIKYQLYMKQRKKVMDKLFIARKTTNPAILAVKRHLRDVRNVQLLGTIPSDFKPYNKDTFSAENIKQLLSAGLQFEDSMKRIVDEVQTVINEVNKIHTLAYQDPSSNILSFSADSTSPEKMKSLVKLKQEKAERKLLRHHAKVEYQSLPDFIRYLDYLVITNFFECTLHGVEKFYHEFIKQRKTG